MKIGIIGLLPAQIHIIKREYPTLDISFLDKNRDREAAAFASHQTKVVLMASFINHPTSHAVPAHKRVLIPGGMTRLREWLNNVSKVEPPKKKERAKPAVPEQKETISNNYKVLLSGEIGQEFKFRRPPTTPIATWQANLASTRSYYSRKHGIETELSIKDAVATIRVTKRNSKEELSTEKPSVKNASANDREFWQKVFIASITAGALMQIAASVADEAVAACNERFA